MGMLIDGQWRELDRAARNGAFVRPGSAFRRFVTANGEFPAEAGRYHLYYGSQRWVNPTGIIPVGPEVDLTSPPGRAGR